jgi:hypothetical protein
MVLLHGFMRKRQKTPQRDIDLALKRKKGFPKQKWRDACTPAVLRSIACSIPTMLP